MTTNHLNWHFLFVEFLDGSIDRIRSQSITTLANYVINNSESIKSYDLSNVVPNIKANSYEILE